MEALQVYPRTAGVNDLGNPVRDAVADGGGLYCQALQQMVVHKEGYYYI
jgi:hypothetical protein